jgi:hypothetical protein
MGGAMSADRTVVGRLWLELVVKHYLACRDADAPRQAKLFDLLDNLTDEFPDAVRAEIDTYRPAAERNATAAKASAGTSAPAAPSKAVNGFSQGRRKEV